MAELPATQTLTVATGDAFKSSRLDLMLRNFTASYKLHWLKGVFDESIEGSTHMTFERLAARMVASVWYPVTYFRLNLGATDMLTDAVLSAQNVCNLSVDAGTGDIVEAVLESKDAEFRLKVKSLYKYVPYRLIRPFYSDRFDEARAEGQYVSESMANGCIARFNRDDAAGAPYRFDADGLGIEIDVEWVRYFSDNRHVVQGWFDYKLAGYLQARNPSVPAIPLKIYAPSARSLTAARKYWEEALRDHVFTDIYSGVPFDEAGFAAHGLMGVDYFIPWSFVLHDELWNLTSMFRDANSSRGNRLPILDQYLRPFCEQQFDALLTLRGTGRHKRVYELYALIDSQVMQYEQTDAALDSFTDSVTKVIVPLHQIAANQGFPTWRPTVDYAVVRL